MAFPAGKVSEGEAGKIPGSPPARNAASGKQAKTPPETETDNIPKVLVINERKPITDMINSFCQPYRSEFKVVVSNRPDQVLSILEQDEAIRLIVSDYKLIAANGADIFSRIRRVNSSVQFIMMPGPETDESIHKTKQSTFVRDLSKPFGLPELIKTIRDTLPLAVTLQEVLQLAGAGGGALVVIVSGSQRGEIIIRRGSIQHAETKEFTGEEAFFQIASWKNFEFTLADPPRDTPSTISRSLPQLWAEAEAREESAAAEREAPLLKQSPEPPVLLETLEEVEQPALKPTLETGLEGRSPEEDFTSDKEDDLFDPDLLRRHEGDPIEERASFNTETALMDDDIAVEVEPGPTTPDELLRELSVPGYGISEREAAVRKMDPIIKEEERSLKTARPGASELDNSKPMKKPSPAPKSLRIQPAADLASVLKAGEPPCVVAGEEEAPRVDAREAAPTPEPDQPSAPPTLRAFNLTDGIERLACGDLGIEDLDAEACVEYHLRDFPSEGRTAVRELPVSSLMGLLKRHIAFRLHWIALSTFRFEDTPFSMDDPPVTKASIALLQALFDSWFISREEYREMLWDAAIFQLSRSLNPCRTIAQYLFSHSEGKLFRIRAMLDAMIERKVIETDYEILNKVFDAYEKQTFRRAVIPISQIENALLKHYHEHETDILWIETPLAVQRMLEINAFGRTEAPVSIKQELLVEMLQNRGLKDAAAFFKTSIPDESAGISVSVYQQMLLYFRD